MRFSVAFLTVLAVFFTTSFAAAQTEQQFSGPLDQHNIGVSAPTRTASTPTPHQPNPVQLVGRIAVPQPQTVVQPQAMYYGKPFVDGHSFGFDSSRLYSPLEGPQLRLQGAPTVASGFGVCESCDEWAGFCNFKEQCYNCGCGGLKANPGHLGLPWLGSKDNCDTQIRRAKASCGCSDSGCGS